MILDEQLFNSGAHCNLCARFFNDIINFMKNIWQYKFPIGQLEIVEEDSFITKIGLAEGTVKTKETSLIKTAKTQLDEYFEGKRKKFDLPIKIEGTDFQKAVYERLIDIPYGKTASYKEITDAIGHKNAYRAVGSACNKNKILIIIPCHRVLASNRGLAGFALGLDVKKYLLSLEGFEI